MPPSVVIKPTLINGCVSGWPVAHNMFAPLEACGHHHAPVVFAGVLSVDAGPALSQHWFNVSNYASSFLICITLNSQHDMLNQRCFDVGQALGQLLMIAGYSNLSQQ